MSGNLSFGGFGSCTWFLRSGLWYGRVCCCFFNVFMFLTTQLVPINGYFLASECSTWNRNRAWCHWLLAPAENLVQGSLREPIPRFPAASPPVMWCDELCSTSLKHLKADIIAYLVHKYLMLFKAARLHLVYFTFVCNCSYLLLFLLASFVIPRMHAENQDYVGLSGFERV